MTSNGQRVGRNILIALGLWWCFSLLGGFVIWAWNWAFVYNRIFTGPSGSALRMALSLPGYVICGVLVGLGAAWFIDSSHVMAWASGLGAIVALGDAKSWNAMLYRGRSVVDTVITALAIAGSILLGCWFGLQLRAARLKRGEVA
jgi:hypothetical protein